MDMIFDIKENILVAELFGELDHHAAADVRKDIDRAMEMYSSENLIFDFTGVTFMDSSGIGVVLGRSRRLEATGGKVAVTGCSLTVRSILNMAGVFSVADYFGTCEEAVEFLSRKEFL